MTRWIALGLMLGACGGKAATPAGDPLSTRVPRVASAAVMATPAANDKVPPLVFVDEDGAVGLAAGPTTWAELGAFQPPAKLATGRPKLFWPRLREDVVLGRDAKEIVAALERMASEPDVGIDLEMAEDVAVRPGAEDDPPPPEEADRPDDGDESGGTGTAVALEEGKLGKPDSDRTEGQYKMKRNPNAPREVPVVGPRGRIAGAYSSLSAFQRPAHDNAKEPEHLGDVAGSIADGPMAHQQLAVAVRPRAKARALLDALVEAEGALLVTDGTQVRPLRLLFGPRARPRDSAMPDADRWLEVRLTAKELVVEAVADKPVIAADPAAVAKAYEELTAKSPDLAKTVDVLIAPDVDAQRLVDVLVALDGAGARSVALGLAPEPDSPQAKLRGKRLVRFALGQPNVQGSIAKADIRRAVAAGAEKLRACYENALAGDPELHGTVQTMFAIDPKGKVVMAESNGVTADVATCISGVIKTLAFPAMPGGGLTQVVFPFSMR